MNACFIIDGKSCIDNTKYNCCNIFTTNLNKVVVATNPNCYKTIKSVTLDGVIKGGGVYNSLYGTNNSYAELRLTALNFATSPINKIFCLNVAPPCNTLETFCSTSDTHQCLFALFNPDLHTCCPTCNFTIPTNNNTVSPPPDNNNVSPPPDNNTVSPPPDNNNVSPPPDNNTVSPPPSNNTVSPPPVNNTQLIDEICVMVKSYC
jgi:hypothetical protein